jgi:hypothetical protein
VGIDPGRWYWQLPENIYDTLSTKGRGTVWQISGAIAAKRANRSKPEYVPDEGGLDGDVNRHEDATSAAQWQVPRYVWGTENLSVPTSLRSVPVEAGPGNAV